MEAALPGSKDMLLNEIRPVNDTRDKLWPFGSIDIDDKHNLAIPTVTIANIKGIHAYFGGNTMLDCGAGGDASKPGVIISHASEISLYSNPKMSVEVTFGPGTPFDGEPVIPTLLDIRNLVVETLDAFERLIRR